MARKVLSRASKVWPYSVFRFSSVSMAIVMAFRKMVIMMNALNAKLSVTTRIYRCTFSSQRCKMMECSVIFARFASLSNGSILHRRSLIIRFYSVCNIIYYVQRNGLTAVSKRRTQARSIVVVFARQHCRRYKC